MNPTAGPVDLKRRWDPTNAFHLNQNIAPTAAVKG